MPLHRLLALAALICAFATHAADPPAPQQVREATEAVYNDPDLHGLKADRELRFKNRERPKEAQASADLRWLRGSPSDR